MKYLGNAFSLNMVADKHLPQMAARPVEAADIPADAVSVVGHADTAAIMTSLLAREVPCNRQGIALVPGDSLYVAQYSGPRLAEGATELPESASFRYVEVVIHDPV